MSAYAKTQAIYRTDMENIAIDFIDDLGNAYTIKMHPSEPLTYLKSIKPLDELTERECEHFQMNPVNYQANVPPFVVRYINASFMDWRSNVEIENVN